MTVSTTVCTIYLLPVRQSVSLLLVVVQLLSRAQLFCKPMDCSPPGSSVRGISQARILEWVCHLLLQGIFPIELTSPAWQAGSLPPVPPGKPDYRKSYHLFNRGLPWWLSSREPACWCGRRRFHPWVEKMPWRRTGKPFQYSCLGNPTDREA